jgi:hypothetical protein
VDISNLFAGSFPARAEETYTLFSGCIQLEGFYAGNSEFRYRLNNHHLKAKEGLNEHLLAGVCDILCNFKCSDLE